MNSFLKDLAFHLYNQYQKQLADLTLVFPNRRAGLFFRKSLAEIVKKPVWAPQIVSMEDFVKTYSDLQVADSISLIFLLYDEYVKVNPQVESFDRFFSWGEIMLKDFDDIDKYLINSNHLFTSVKEQKLMEEKFDYLTNEQKQVIKSFWSSFGDKISSQQQGFLKIWDLLPVIYKSFQQRLLNEKLAYEGLLYKDVVQKCTDNIISHKRKKIIFAGFNSLSTSEELIIKYFIKSYGADIFWDVDKSYMENVNLEAGTFLRKYAKDKIFAPSFPSPLPDRLYKDKEKNIEIIGVPMAVGQAKLLGEKLSNLALNTDTKDLTKTVVVLPEESLLFPVLHSLPANINDVNITMGFPLQYSSLHSFFEHLINFQQQQIDNDKGEYLFHYKIVLSLLKHPIFIRYNRFLSIDLTSYIEKNNLVYVPSSLLQKNDALYNLVFNKIKSVNKLIDYLLDILLLLNQSLEENKQNDGKKLPLENNPVQEVEDLSKSLQLEKEYIFQYYTLLTRIKSIIVTQEIEINYITFQKLFRQLVSSFKLPFSGEPLSGLQIMGALETRNLDFENVFILSLNEGAFPAKGPANSYIPFNLRKGFGLPTVDQQDANYAYTFYRLLQRAKKIFLFHNTEIGNNLNGEMSRYLFQLLYESPYTITSTVLSNSIKPGAKLPITIQKTQHLLDKLEKYIVTEGNSLKRLNPSALNIYLECRLKFYFRYVIELQENDKIQDTLDPAIFGNILHLIMEKLYEDIISQREKKEVFKEDYDLLNKNIEGSINDAFSRYFSNNTDEAFNFKGAQIIAKEIIEKYTRQILNLDRLYAPFQILGLEANEKEGYILNLAIPTESGDIIVGFKGVIDRIDFKDDVVRVIDYKSGSDNKNIESIASLFERDNPKRNKAAFQTFFYGLLFLEKHPHTPYEIMPGIYNIKEMFGESFDFRLVFKNRVQKINEPVNSVKPFIDSYLTGLRSLVAEIFQSSIPFDQTDDLKKCTYCPYSGICHR